MRRRRSNRKTLILACFVLLAAAVLIAFIKAPSPEVTTKVSTVTFKG